MGDYIGALVKRFESGTKGSLSLSSCGNDWGLSCGSYQLTLRWGNCIKFLQKYFPEQAKTLYFRSNKPDIKTNKWPGKDYCSSPDQVKAVWKACYNAVGAEKFFSYEHEHIQNGYYEQLMKKLGGYFNPNNHSRAMQECMWSWAVHRGTSGAYTEFCEACNAARINPQKAVADDLIDILYDKRFSIAGTRRYKKGAGADSERETLRDYCNVAPLPYKGTNPSTGAANGVISLDQEPATTSVWYRVGTDWKNGKCVGQVGAYHNLSIAKDNCKPGQKVFDEKGNVVYAKASTNETQFASYTVRITASTLNVRSNPGTSHNITTAVHKGEVYTIVAEQTVGNTKWGKLKSGAGWISLDFARRT